MRDKRDPELIRAGRRLPAPPGGGAWSPQRERAPNTCAVPRGTTHIGGCSTGRRFPSETGPCFARHLALAPELGRTSHGFSLQLRVQRRVGFRPSLAQDAPCFAGQDCDSRLHWTRSEGGPPLLRSWMIACVALPDAGPSPS